MTPASCAAPCDKLSDILNADLAVQAAWTPPGRFAFLTLAEDTVISADFDYTLADYPAAMTSFSASLPSAPAAATFIVQDLPVMSWRASRASRPTTSPGWADGQRRSGLERRDDDRRRGVQRR